MGMGIIAHGGGYRNILLLTKALSNTIFPDTMQRCDILRYINFGEISCSFWKNLSLEFIDYAVKLYRYIIALLPICIVLLSGTFNFCLNLRKLTSRSSKTWHFGLWLYTKERNVRSTFRRLGGLKRRKLSKRDDVTSTTWRECSD